MAGEVAAAPSITPAPNAPAAPPVPPVAAAAPPAPPAAPASALATTPPAVDAAKPALGADGKSVEAAKPDAAAPAEIKFTLPEGYRADDTFVTSTQDTVKAFAAQAGLNEKQANAALAALLPGAKEAAAQQAERAGWAEAIRKDPEIGGEKYDANIRAAVSVFSKFGKAGAEAQQAIDKAGLGNNPALVKLFVQLGRSLGEDSMRGALGGGAAPEKTKSQILGGIYTNTPKELL